MTFRDKRRHKIDNYVTGRCVLTIKVDKDGQFKKFKARKTFRHSPCYTQTRVHTIAPAQVKSPFCISLCASTLIWCARVCRVTTEIVFLHQFLCIHLILGWGSAGSYTSFFFVLRLRPFYTQTSLTETILHADPFADRPFHTQTLLHRNTFTQICF